MAGAQRAGGRDFFSKIGKQLLRLADLSITAAQSLNVATSALSEALTMSCRSPQICDWLFAA